MSVEAVVATGRRLIGSTLLDSGLVHRRTLASDDTAGRTETWAPVGAAVACRFGTLVDPEPSMIVDAIYGPPTAQVLMPLGTAAERGDRIQNVATGTMWLVVGIKTAESVLAVAERFLIREV